jgi:hypothetical protein
MHIYQMADEISFQHAMENWYLVQISRHHNRQEPHTWVGFLKQETAEDGWWYHGHLSKDRSYIIYDFYIERRDIAVQFKLRFA